MVAEICGNFQIKHVCLLAKYDLKHWTDYKQLDLRWPQQQMILSKPKTTVPPSNEQILDFSIKQKSHNYKAFF